MNKSKLDQQKEDLKNLSINISFCEDCNLHKTRKRTCAGNGFINKDSEKIRFLFIGEAPGADENEQGKVFVGVSGRLLRNALREIGFIDYYITNTVKCRPPENRNPSKQELELCGQFLAEQIDIINPEAIILIGKVAYNNFKAHYSNLFKEDFIYTIWHPSYILRNGGKDSERYNKWYKQLESIWQRIKQ